jgi:DNA-binding transcriptional LysR family regulator
LKMSDLHILLAVAQCGSMAKAASQLAVSHPVVSRAISQLEHTLGVRLLERTPRGVSLTAYGRAMLNRSRAAFDELRNGVKDIESLADPTAGEVRIGSTVALGESVVAALVDRLFRRYPRFVFNILTGSSEEMRTALNERRVDLLIARERGPIADKRLCFESLYENPYIVAAAVENPWAHRRRIELSDLFSEMWTLPPTTTFKGAVAEEAFRASGLEYPHVNVVAFSDEVRISLLRTGRFLTVLPRSVLTFPVKRRFIKELPVEFRATSGSIGLLTDKDRVLSPAAQLFVHSVREVAKDNSTWQRIHKTRKQLRTN